VKSEKKQKLGDTDGEQLDFELVLFATAIIDYDYIMHLITAYAAGSTDKQTMTREELINLIKSDAKFQDEAESIEAYINTLSLGEGLTEAVIRQGYENFKTHQSARDMAALAQKHGIALSALQGFVDQILNRMIFDGERLNELFEPLGLGWKARTKKELELMEDLIPLLHKLAQGREISGLGAYEE
jgi:type I restriction enzyme R subunit